MEAVEAAKQRRLERLERFIARREGGADGEESDDEDLAALASSSSSKKLAASKELTDAYRVLNMDRDARQQMLQKLHVRSQ